MRVIQQFLYLLTPFLCFWLVGCGSKTEAPLPQPVELPDPQPERGKLRPFVMSSSGASGEGPKVTSLPHVEQEPSRRPEPVQAPLPLAKTFTLPPYKHTVRIRPDTYLGATYTMPEADRKRLVQRMLPYRHAKLDLSTFERRFSRSATNVHQIPVAYEVVKDREEFAKDTSNLRRAAYILHFEEGRLRSSEHSSEPGSQSHEPTLVFYDDQDRPTLLVMQRPIPYFIVSEYDARGYLARQTHFRILPKNNEVELVDTKLIYAKDEYKEVEWYRFRNTGKIYDMAVWRPENGFSHFIGREVTKSKVKFMDDNHAPVEYGMRPVFRTPGRNVAFAQRSPKAADSGARERAMPSAEFTLPPYKHTVRTYIGTTYNMPEADRRRLIQRLQPFRDATIDVSTFEKRFTNIVGKMQEMPVALLALKNREDLEKEDPVYTCYFEAGRIRFSDKHDSRKDTLVYYGRGLSSEAKQLPCLFLRSLEVEIREAHLSARWLQGCRVVQISGREDLSCDVPSTERRIQPQGQL